MRWSGEDAAHELVPTGQTNSDADPQRIRFVGNVMLDTTMGGAFLDGLVGSAFP